MEIKNARIVEQLYKSNMNNNDRQRRNTEQKTNNSKTESATETKLKEATELSKEIAKTLGVGENLDERI